MRRGLTLLELLLALALLAVLASIALPAMLETSEHEKLKQTAEAIEEQLLQARAHAMVEGVAIEVRFDPLKRCVQVCEAQPAGIAERDVEEPPSEPELVKRAWAELVVAERVSVSNESPEALQESEAPNLDAFSVTALRMSAPLEQPGESEAEPMTFALFLPDGSAPVAEPIWLTTEDGRAMRIDIGLWTGIPRIEPNPTPESAATIAEETQESEATEETAPRDSAATETEPAELEPFGDDASEDGAP